MSAEPKVDWLAVALDYAARGWAIIPIKHKTGTKGKQPAIRTWKRYQTRRPSESELRDWFGGKRKIDGLAVLLGDASGGLVCRDFDKLNAYEKWAAKYPKLASTLPTVETARGTHVYFRSTWRGFTEFDDGELRGTSGHYCVLPPSKHPNGSQYRWIVPLPDSELPEHEPESIGLATGTTEKQRNREAEDTEETETLSSKRGEQQEQQSLDLESIDPLIEKAIEATMPQKFGVRNRAIFEYARHLKAIPQLFDAGVTELKCLVRRWHARALPYITTKDFDDTWADFTLSWESVKFPAGENPMEKIKKAIEAGDYPKAADAYDPPTKRLISACRELQRLNGESPFFISCRTAAEFIDRDYTIAWKRLRMLEAVGILAVVKRGNTSKATRYRYMPPIDN